MLKRWAGSVLILTFINDNMPKRSNAKREIPILLSLRFLIIIPNITIPTKANISKGI